MTAKRLAVVSYFGEASSTPRGDRTQWLVRSLAREWEIELVAASLSPQVTRSRPGRRLHRRLAHSLHTMVLLDRFEPWSHRRLKAWEPRFSGAVLVGFPFSPLVYASRQLHAFGVPYVVDVGDPWVLTAPDPEPWGLALRRARKAEHRLWSWSAGAIVTTSGQADRLGQRFPRMRVLVRPNGYAPLDPGTAEPQDPPTRDDSVLRLAHFGVNSSARADISRFARALSRSSAWERIELHQFGPDWTGALVGLEAEGWQTRLHDPLPWSEAVAIAGSFDAVLVIGNRDTSQLPSKASSYLQLNAPRIAVVSGAPDDALREYVQDRAGWIVVQTADPQAAGRVAEHVGRPWKLEALAPPPDESWEVVSARLAAFIGSCFRDEDEGSAVPVDVLDERSHG